MTTARKSIVTLSLGMLVATSLTGFAAAQGGPAMPGPTGAPKVGPTIVVPGRTPPIGEPVVLEPPTIAPPSVPLGTRPPIQGQVVRETDARRALNLRCPVSPQGQYSRFATITGKVENGSRLVMTGDCYGTQSADLIIGVTSESGFLPYFLDDESVRFGWEAFTLPGSSWAPSRIEFRVIHDPDPAQQPVAPPKKLFLSLQGRNGINFRAFLTQQDIDTLNAGGTIINPPAS